jgi:hypothetical protein
MHHRLPPLAATVSLVLFAGIAVLTSQPVYAQATGYTIGENSTLPAIDGLISSPTAEGPVRLARFSLIKGHITWKSEEDTVWNKAIINLPLRQGTSIRVPKGGRAEIQFDDGSILRLGSNALISLKSLSSDSEGEFTEIRFLRGLAALRTRHERSLYQCDTPLVTVKTTGLSKLRIGVAFGVELGVRAGNIRVAGDNVNAVLREGDYVNLLDSTADLTPYPLPEKDTWELWNDERDAVLAEAEKSYRQHNLPENLALVAGDLDTYGDWRDDPTYGMVWCPRDIDARWKPYMFGRWQNFAPFGQTWISDEPWGWAPYHYGTWIQADYGWAWVPGPIYQYWSPGLVRFTEVAGRLTWRPLTPSEVQYPTLLSFGFQRRHWYRYFSAGQVATYQPTGKGPSAPIVYNTTIVHETINNIVNQPVQQVENTVYIYEDDHFSFNGGHAGLGFQSGYPWYGYYFVPPYSRPTVVNSPPVLSPSAHNPRIPPQPRPVPRPSSPDLNALPQRPPARPTNPPATVRNPRADLLDKIKNVLKPAPANPLNTPPDNRRDTTNRPENPAPPVPATPPARETGVSSPMAPPTGPAVRPAPLRQPVPAPVVTPPTASTTETSTVTDSAPPVSRPVVRREPPVVVAPTPQSVPVPTLPPKEKANEPAPPAPVPSARPVVRPVPTPPQPFVRPAPTPPTPVSAPTPVPPVVRQPPAPVAPPVVRPQPATPATAPAQPSPPPVRQAPAPAQPYVRPTPATPVAPTPAPPVARPTPAPPAPVVRQAPAPPPSAPAPPKQPEAKSPSPAQPVPATPPTPAPATKKP